MSWRLFGIFYTFFCKLGRKKIAQILEFLLVPFICVQRYQQPNNIRDRVKPCCCQLISWSSSFHKGSSNWLWHCRWNEALIIIITIIYIIYINKEFLHKHCLCLYKNSQRLVLVHHALTLPLTVVTRFHAGFMYSMLYIIYIFLVYYYMSILFTI